MQSFVQRSGRIAMPARYPKPFFRTALNCWYVQLGTKQIRLDPDKEQAFRLYHELMQREPQPDQPHILGHRVDELLDAFLDWCQRNQAKRTYD